MSIIWDWDRKVQDAFEQAKILVGQTKHLSASLPQCPFLLEVTSYSDSYSWWLCQKQPEQIIPIGFGLSHGEEQKLCTQYPL